MKALLAIFAFVMATTVPAWAQNTNPVSYSNGSLTGLCTAAQAASGTCPIGSFISLNPGNYVGIRFVLSGATGSGATVQLYVSPVGACTSYQPISFIEKSANDQLATSTTLDGLFDANGMNACNAEVVVTAGPPVGAIAVTLTAGPADVVFNSSGLAGNVAVTNFPSSQNVVVTNSPTVGVNNFPSSFAVTQPTGANLHMNCDNCPVSPSWNYFVVPPNATCVSPSVCVIKNSPGTLAGIINNSTSQQAAGICTIWDNASAASGQKLLQENGLLATQVIEATANGMKAVNGIVIQCAANPSGDGLLVEFL